MRKIGVDHNTFGAVSPPLSCYLATVSQVCTLRLLGRSACIPLHFCPCSAPLQWHVNSCSLFHGSAFGLYQPSWQGIQFCALLWQNPDNDLAWSYGGTSRQRSGSPNTPGSMPQALRWQWNSFTFVGVNFCGFDIPRIGVQPCMQTSNGQVLWAAREDK